MNPEDEVNWHIHYEQRCFFFPGRDCPGCQLKCARIGYSIEWQKDISQIENPSSSKNAGASISPGALYTYLGNVTKAELSGDLTVTNTHPITNGDGESEKQISGISTHTETDLDNILFSEDFNDPTLYETLQWHIKVCLHCKLGLTKPPPDFGFADTRHCTEYYEIVEEYGEYETRYAWKGNP